MASSFPFTICFQMPTFHIAALLSSHHLICAIYELLRSTNTSMFERMSVENQKRASPPRHTSKSMLSVCSGLSGSMTSRGQLAIEPVF